MTHTSILSINADAKTVKGLARGYLTAISYLTPANGYRSTVTLCPRATSGCTLACLGHGGRFVMTPVYQARARRTRLFLDSRDAFMRNLVRELDAFTRRAARLDLTPAVRLNGTSDVLWERIPVDGAANIMERFADVQFYDYTKISARLTRPLPRNYHLTLSWAEGRERDAQVAFDHGINVARVFRNATRPHTPARLWSLPESFDGREMLDGDATDLRFLDPQSGLWVGLKAKGKATRDASGFVTDVEPLITD